MKFPKDTSETSLINWPTVLTEFRAFTVCFWHKLYVEPETSDQQMTLLRYYAHDGNFTLFLKNFDTDAPKLTLVIWPRYDFAFWCT